MATVPQSILADILRLGNAPISDNTVPAIRTLLTKVLDYADSLTAKGTTPDELADFEDTLDNLTGVADNLDAACDNYEIAEDDDSKEGALESAGEALTDIAASLQELDSLAQYIESTETTVATRWSIGLRQLPTLPPHERGTALESLLREARTPKESSTLLSLAKEAILRADR